MSQSDMSEAEYSHAERHGWRVSKMGAESSPRPQMTAHLYTAAQMTACGIGKVLAVSVPATEHDVPCRDCSDAVDPFGAAALMPDEVPFLGD